MRHACRTRAWLLVHEFRPTLFAPVTIPRFAWHDVLLPVGGWSRDRLLALEYDAGWAAEECGGELGDAVRSCSNPATTLQSEGPAATVRVCSDIAQERTAAFATDGVYVRRVSERLRNPRNAPDAAEAIELQRLQVLTAEGRLPPEVVRIVRTGEERSLHLLRPIRIQPPCLTCHGQEESIPPDVRQILAERYPDDRAVGYETGDLRGAISVRVPLPMR